MREDQLTVVHGGWGSEVIGTIVPDGKGGGVETGASGGLEAVLVGTRLIISRLPGM